MQNKESRSETDILQELEELCQSSGYSHAIAYLCFRDNMIFYSETLKPKDLEKFSSPNRLTRSEISILIGFMIKKEVDFSIPSLLILQQMLDKTEKLLKQLHDSINHKIFFGELFKEGSDPTKENPFRKGSVLREAIFYSAESAYQFQYKDFCIKKYNKDNEWLVKNKGFSIEQAVAIVEAICEMPTKHYMRHMRALKNTNPNEWTVLPIFTFSAQDLIENSVCPIDVIESFLSAFSLSKSKCNEQFYKLGDWNLINTKPLIPSGNGYYTNFQSYTLWEALYESPFFWMGDDNDYKATRDKNRGRFAEDFALERLLPIFGKERVYKNVKIRKRKGIELPEIDVLVAYADRAIILQAKSKRLTIEARKGNDNALQEDFSKGIQAAYEQGWKSANAILEGGCTFIDESGKEISVRNNFKEIFIFCILSDYYPSLSFQAKQFLQYQKHSVIAPPFVMDVFFFDVMTEFLKNPLHLLSYAHKRTGYSEKLLSSNELVLLSYHLKVNLYVEEQYSMMHIDDNVAHDLDAAFIVRRDGIDGKDTPDGILTKYKNHPFGKLIDYLSNFEEDGALDLGFLLLSLNEKTAKDIGEAIDKITETTRRDFALHDFSALIGDAGITFHCSYAEPNSLAARLVNHCEIRKYKEKAKRWFGLGRYAGSKEPFQVAIMLGGEWQHNQKMEDKIKNIENIKTPKSFRTLQEAFNYKTKKVGRNEPCPCGSGIKSKKCHYK